MFSKKYGQTTAVCIFDRVFVPWEREGFYACGVAGSVYARPDEHSGSFMPDPVFVNIGKLLLASQIYDMHRIAHYESGGLVVSLPGPDEDHNTRAAGTASSACTGAARPRP